MWCADEADEAGPWQEAVRDTSLLLLLLAASSANSRFTVCDTKGGARGARDTRSIYLTPYNLYGSAKSNQFHSFHSFQLIHHWPATHAPLGARDTRPI